MIATGAKLKDKDSVKQVIAAMTLEEKLTALTGESVFKGPAMERYGIPQVYYLDGGTGANMMQMVMDIYFRLHPIRDINEALGGGAEEGFHMITRVLECLTKPEKLEQADEALKEEVERVSDELKSYIPGGELPGCFPPGIVFGATWDSENIYACGRALGKETHYYGIDVLLGTPNVNIHRDPLNGRLFEGYSEDPCLVAKLAPAFVRGIQDEGIIANVKHFAANNQETDRRTINEHIPERALREIYLPGFRACVEAGCKSVMSAYNAINGEFCAHNRWLLTDLLRGEWGFEGFVVSDWGAAYDQVKAWSAGNDMDMPGPRPIDRVIAAVESGELEEARIDESLERYLNIVLEMPVMRGRRYTAIDREESARAAYESIKEGAVLLKNRAGTLPLSKDSGVCFWSEYSKQFLESGGGSANVVTGESTSMYGVTREKLGEDRVTFEEIRPETDVVIVTGVSMGQEGFDRAAMDLDNKQEVLDAVAKAKAAGKRVVVILNVCGPVDVSDYEADADAILCVFIPGMEGGRVAAEILLGEVNPSGRLPVTFPGKYRDCPTSDSFPGRGNETWYGEGILVGYRYYDYRAVEPRYPFGHGLSYTTFTVTGAELSKDILELDGEDSVTLTATVKNTGAVAGKEVVQVYIGQRNPTLVKPPKELKDFCKVALEPGEEKQVSFTITRRQLESYDELHKGWVAEPDCYDILVGRSSRQIDCTVQLTAVGWNPNGFGSGTPLSEIAANPDALDTVLRYIPAGTLSKEEIALTLLFQGTSTLEAFWNTALSPAIDAGQEEKETRWRQLLKEINRYR